MATGLVPRGHWRGATHHADCWGEGEGGGEECDVSELYDHLEVVLRAAVSGAVSGAVRGAWRGGSGSGEGKEVAVREGGCDEEKEVAGEREEVAGRGGGDSRE